MVSRTSWRCLKTPVSVTTLINGDGCLVLMPLNQLKLSPGVLKNMERLKIRSSVWQPCWMSLLPWFEYPGVWAGSGSFSCCFDILEAESWKKRHTDFNHFVIKRRQSEFHLVYWVKPADIRTVPASADSPTLLKSFVLKSSMYSRSHWNAHNVASCGQSHQRKRRAMNIHNNRGASSICTKAAHATYLCLFTVLQFALG